MAHNSQFTLFLIGPVGHGKSTFCNFLFREQKFHEKENFVIFDNPKSQIFNTNSCTVEYASTQITLYDFPGFLDYRFPSEKIYNEIREAGLTANPDCFGYVINFGKRMSAAEFKKMQMMIETFGTGVWEHMIAIFTFEDTCTKYFSGQTGREFVESILGLENAPDAMVNLMPRINKRYMILDNKSHGNDEEYWNNVFSELIGLMKEVRELNRGVPFDGSNLGHGMEFYLELEKRGKAAGKIIQEHIDRGLAKLYSDNKIEFPNPILTGRNPNLIPVVKKQSEFLRVKLHLKNFYMSHPNFVIPFVLTAPFSLFLCYNFACRMLKIQSSFNSPSIFKWINLAKLFS